MSTLAPARRWKLAAAVAAVTLWAGCQKSVPEIAAPEACEDDLPAVAAGPDQAPWWRSDGGLSRQPAATEWSDTKNVRWQVDIPGRGHSSPSVWQDRVLVSTADDREGTISLLCLRRDDGHRLWDVELFRGKLMHRHEKNSHASPTPACDGQRVFVPSMVEQGIFVTASSLDDGELLWRTKAGPFTSMHGYGSSPLIWNSLVIVSADSAAGGYIAALHRESGEICWRTSRPGGASFGTPAVLHVDGRDVLVLAGHRRVAGYDPDNGKRLWQCEGPASTVANTAATDGRRVFVSGGYPQRAVMAIEPSQGSAKVVWKKDWKVYVPSPLVSQGRLYVVQDNGIARCLRAEDGQELWTQRLSGGFTASPMLAGGHVYMANEQGLTRVFRDADEYQQTAVNELPAGIYATPTAAGAELLVRTLDRLYCIAAPAGGADDAAAADAGKAP